MAVRLDPFQRIVNVHWGETEKLFYMYSGIDESVSDVTTTGTAGEIPGTDWPPSINLSYRNPSDPNWIATCTLLVTIHATGSSPELQLAWTGTFTDGRTDGDSNDMPWLDGLQLSVIGYGDLPALLGPGSPFAGPSRTTYDGLSTRYTWVNFPNTGAIPLLPVSVAPETTEGRPSRFQITYPGWEDFWNHDSTAGT